MTQRCGVRPTSQPVDGERSLHHGSLEQVLDDLAAGAAAGVDEVLLDIPAGARDARELTERAELVAGAVREAGA